MSQKNLKKNRKFLMSMKRYFIKSQDTQKIIGINIIIQYLVKLIKLLRNLIKMCNKYWKEIIIGNKYLNFMEGEQ